jgi:hypothetical protein
MVFGSKDGKIEIPGVGFLPLGFVVGDFDPNTNHAPITDAKGNYRGYVNKFFGNQYDVCTENKYGHWQIFVSSKQYWEEAVDFVAEVNKVL